MADPYTIEQFRGLYLQVDTLEAGAQQAVDLLNVDFDRPGRVRTRDGTAQWNNSTLSSSGYSALIGTSAITNGALVAVRYSSGGNVNLDQITTAGVASALGSGSISGAANTYLLSHTDFGGLTSTTLFMTFVTQPSTGIQIVIGTGVGTPTGGGYKPLYVTTTPVSNRLAVGGFFAAADSPTGADGSRSTVFFSDAGNAFSFSANNWVTLRPGDGEVITGMVTFGNDLYVFKQSSVFIFYGEDTSADGEPEFNYRKIDLPDPMVDPVPNAPNVPYVAVGPDGVYYSTANGVWRTNGGPPQMLSTPVHKIFSRDPTISTSLLNATTNAPPALAWAAGKLIATYTNAAGSIRQLVWSPETDTWTLWDVPGISFAQYPAGVATARDSLYYVRGSGNNNVFVMRPTSSDDSGTPIAWSYTSGSYSPANDPGRVSVSLESRLVGSGTVTLQVATINAASSSNGSFDTGSAVTLGTSPAIADGWQQIDREGTHFQHKMSGSGQAQVNELVHYLSFVKAPGLA